MQRTLRTRRALSALLTVGVAITTAACGDPADEVDTASPAASRTGDEVSADLGETSLGEVLVDADGMTLYGFTDDTDGTSTCTGACADAWPPATTSEPPPLAPGLDLADFGVVEHPEVGGQLKVGDWPLYTFAGDAEPGDVNGQGSGGVWFAVAADGTLVDGPAEPTAGSRDPGY